MYFCTNKGQFLYEDSIIFSNNNTHTNILLLFFVFNASIIFGLLFKLFFISLSFPLYIKVENVFFLRSPVVA